MQTNLSSCFEIKESNILYIDIFSHTALKQIWEELENISQIQPLHPKIENLSRIEGLSEDKTFEHTIERYRSACATTPSRKTLCKLLQEESEKRTPHRVQHRLTVFKSLNSNKSNCWLHNGECYMINVNHPVLNPIKRIIEDFGKGIVLTGCFFYPDGAFRAWHTNKYDRQGWRMYIIKVDGESYFRYIDNETGSIIQCKDINKTVRLFQITNDPPFWHSVYSKCNRWSVGFYLPDDVFNALIER